jgi:outer membrane lipoprotein SlyB
LRSDKRLNSGTAIGAAVGYGAAREVKGHSRSAIRVAAGTIGGMAGTAIQNGMSSRRGVEVYVRDLESGKVFAFLQADDLLIRPGDKVFLTGKGSKTRVVPMEGQR